MDLKTHKKSTHFNFLLIIYMVLLLLPIVNAKAQSRIYVSGGLTGSFGGPSNLLKDYTDLYGYPYLGMELENKLAGSVYLVTGLSFYRTGYTSDDRFFGSAIRFRGNYLAAPLMVRFNYKNRNYFYLDFGFNPYYLIHAYLQESINQFNQEKVVEGKITEHSEKVFFGVKFQGTIAINRFILSAYAIVPFEGQTVTRNLDQYWGLNKQQSTYLLNNNYLPTIFGVKTGIRIK